jgi:imidazolonepropionase-like amidohydrolase
MEIQGGKVKAVGAHLSAKGAKEIDLNGKTIMPALINAHAHLGTIKGNTTNGANYTRENVLAHLQRYENYGVLTVLALGTDHPPLFENGLYDSVRNGLSPGARLYSAGYGFGVNEGGPPLEFGMDKVFRPTDVSQVKEEVQELKRIHVAVVKMWVDDFAGRFQKMKPEVYHEIIRQCHANNLRVASHVYYLDDAKQLVNDGVDILAHSIRDKEIDDALINEMKQKKIFYIPTLAIDEYSFIYSREPEWLNDPFFKAALEPGVYEMASSKEYHDNALKSPQLQRNINGFQMAQKNLKKIYQSGVVVAMGTDSGAQPIRAQGFSEHLELQLMVEAGLTPMEAITIATKNAAKALKIDKDFGTLEPGKTADFIVLSESPETDIKNTRKIESVWKAGREVSQGPLK